MYITMHALINYRQTIRNYFDEYETKAKLLSDQEEQEKTKSPKKTCLSMNHRMDSLDEFRIKTCIVILDTFKSQIRKTLLNVSIVIYISIKMYGAATRSPMSVKIINPYLFTFNTIIINANQGIRNKHVSTHLIRTL